MFHVHVESIIHKDIDTVFEILADDEGYSRFRGVKAAKLLEPGQAERNGLGTLRHIDLGAVREHSRTQPEELHF